MIEIILLIVLGGYIGINILMAIMYKTMSPSPPSFGEVILVLFLGLFIVVYSMLSEYIKDLKDECRLE
jgi:RsiW-degrading membrane proteinase PrsW (M82 family)